MCYMEGGADADPGPERFPASLMKHKSVPAQLGELGKLQ